MDWVSAKELLDALGAKTAVSSTTFAICRRACAGLLETRATALVVSDGKPQKDASIPSQFWWAEGHEALEQDWVRGDFSTWMKVRDREMEVKAFGVQFKRSEAEAMGATFGEMAGSLLMALPTAETLEDWAERVVDCGLLIGGFTKAILRASWRGPNDTVPTVKAALGALQDR